MRFFNLILQMIESIMQFCNVLTEETLTQILPALYNLLTVELKTFELFSVIISSPDDFMLVVL